MYRILVLNPGATSMKIAIYENQKCIEDESLTLKSVDSLNSPLSRDQVKYRKKAILEWIKRKKYTINDFNAIAIRGAPIPSGHLGGTYLIKDIYQDELMALYFPDKPPVHDNRLLLPLVLELIGDRDIPIYMTDPPSVDELTAEAKVSGVKGYTRKASFHALNQKAVARKYAKEVGKSYFDCRLIVAHLGGGISVGAHLYGRVVDVNNASEGSGPFTPQRAGTVETRVMMELCYDKKFSKDQVHYLTRNESGLLGMLGTDDLKKVEEWVEAGDKQATIVFNAMAYQISKEIGSCVAVLSGKVDAIILTGGISHSKQMVSEIEKYVGCFAPIVVYAGEFENEALALGAYRVLSGLEEPVHSNND